MLAIQVKEPRTRFTAERKSYGSDVTGGTGAKWQQAAIEYRKSREGVQFVAAIGVLELGPSTSG